MKILFLVHGADESPGTIEKWAWGKGASFTIFHPYRGDAFPPPSHFDTLVVMGGTMSTYQEAKYPWLVEEKRFIRRAIDDGKKVLGICLGSQLVADVLGAKVSRAAHKEIGWFPVEFTPEAQRLQILDGTPARMMTFHWHGDSFELPKGAVRLASSAGCAQQGFLYGDKVIAWQFHPEMAREDVAEFVRMMPGDLKGDSPFVQSASVILGQIERSDSLWFWLARFLDRFLLGSGGR